MATVGSSALLWLGRRYSIAGVTITKAMADELAIADQVAAAKIPGGALIPLSLSDTLGLSDVVNTLAGHVYTKTLGDFATITDGLTTGNISIFIAIDKPWHIRQSSNTDTISTAFEGGYVQTRARHTRARKKFTLAWDLLSSADYNALTLYFESIARGRAASFAWTHPATLVSHLVRFGRDTIEAELVAPGYWKTEVDLEEV